MNRARALGRFAWDFVVGDDWRIALGVVAALALAAGLNALGAAAWWLMPLAVAALLTRSLLRATRAGSS
jgi:uncharacterized membrane protein